MAVTINAETLGAWVLKCNPKVWDIAGFMADGYNWISDWSVQNNYRSQLMSVNDPVVLWVTGSTGAAVTPGVWAVGRVTAPIEVRLRDDEVADGPPVVEDESEGEQTYWVDAEARARATFYVSVDLPFFDDPLSREEIRANRALRDTEVLRQPQMGNPSWMTQTEWEALQGLLGDRALQPADPADVANWQREAEVAEPDPEARVLVESAAIGYVQDSLEADGWDVEDVQHENLGWDLIARRGRKIRRIEVKGRGPLVPIVHLTANEVHAARSVEAWELAVVTGALGTPKLRWFAVEAVLAAAKPVTFRADLR